jgi:tyrosyl-tRNA synthetase
MKKQFSRLIEYTDDKALLLDNAEWLSDLNYIDFLRDIGRHFSVNRMLGFEAYKMRLETGLSFIEFNYQLLQSYDFLVLYKQYGCKLQIGGDDQWGNIVSGADLVRRIEGTEVIGLTFPLVTRADGKKMGKTEKGALYLDAEMTPPYEFYQYWRNVPDPDVEKLLFLFTFVPADEVIELGRLKDKEINRAKERLAYELTKIVHGEEEAEKSLEAAKAAFSVVSNGDAGQGGKDTGTEGIPSLDIPASEFEEGIGILDLFSRTTLCSSNSEARRLVEQGGAWINDTKVEDSKLTIDPSWIKDGQLLLRAGKKRYFRVVCS